MRVKQLETCLVSSMERVFLDERPTGNVWNGTEALSGERVNEHLQMQRCRMAFAERNRDCIRIF